MTQNKKAKKNSKKQADEQVIEPAQASASTELQPQEKDTLSVQDESLSTEVHQRFQLSPDEFIESQNKLEEQHAERREHNKTRSESRV